MSLKDKLDNISISVQPRCVTCGCDDQFEYNEDYSYIKCLCCGREYFGGRDELLVYNQDAINEAKQRLQSAVTPILQQELLKAFKRKQQ